MNRQLIANAFDKLAECAALFAEGFRQPADPQDTAEDAASPATTAAPEPKAEPAKKARKSAAPKAAPKVEEPEETEDDEETEDADGEEGEAEGDDLADVEETEDEESGVSRDALRKSIVAYAKKHGKPKAYALLEKYGSKNVDGLKEKDLEKVNAAIQKGLK